MEQIEHVEKVTRERLQKMERGESRTFGLPDARAIDSAGTTAYQIANIEGCTYSVQKDYVGKTINISKQ